MPLTIVDLTIAAGESVSSPLDLSNRRPVWLGMAPGWKSALLTVQVSADGIAWFDLYDTDAREIAYNVAPGTAIRLQPDNWGTEGFIRLRSGSALNPVPQPTAATINIALTAQVISGTQPAPAR